ncbi:hypothetical protein [Dactylosporangium cerinum]
MGLTVFAVLVVAAVATEALLPRRSAAAVTSSREGCSSCGASR